MGKKAKLGKGRRDKFYRLAKETGYRSRSSFKLIQLNRKFQFLQKSRALIDLCAAPGGWLQVAANFMPVSSLVIGVDLVPIRAIPNVVTIQEDITTDKCRQALRKELQTWKVDVVLNDGAPNVGSNWLHDAYSQAHLTLMALKLACDFLTRGGWFITKVFRSRDYQPLVWILQQFFRKVQATKPQASRNESAEIFVVCQGYLAPNKIDSKFFDPKYAFKEVEVEAKSIRDLVNVKKAKAEGYTEGDFTLYHRFTLMDFLKASNPVDFLDKANEIVLENPELESLSVTTHEIRECCKDIRVLGRKELRSLLNWRGKLRRFLARKLKEEPKSMDGDISLSSGEESESEREKATERKKEKAGEGEGGEEEEEEDGDDEEETMDKQLALCKAEELAELKRKKKKVLKEKRKQQERCELKMDLPGALNLEETDTSMFSLLAIRHDKLAEVMRGDMLGADRALSEGALGEDDVCVSEGDSDTELEEESTLPHASHTPKARRPAGRARAECASEEEEEAEGDEEGGNPLVVELEGREERAERHSHLWFSKSVFADLDIDNDEDVEINQSKKLQQSLPSGETEAKRREGTVEKKERREGESEGEIRAVEHTEDKEDDSSSDESDIQGMKDKQRQNKEPEPPLEQSQQFDIIPIDKSMKRARVLDPEGLALGAALATSKHRSRNFMDDSFNRRAVAGGQVESHLPDWFVDDEMKHWRAPVPFDPAMAEEFRLRWKEINARPIKKVAEAKARKKRRLLKKMEDARKKAEAVVNTVDISEREKMAQMRTIYQKAGVSRERRSVTYVVVKRGAGRWVRRPAGVKGLYRAVDARLKKDLRGQGARATGKGGKGRARGGAGAKGARGAAKGGKGKAGGKGRGK
uniref:pre-rRNA processing protein FTSJ3 n=1 Tax=Callorhinchus milii TaxID=7868 RepID=V9KFM5_CALMI